MEREITLPKYRLDALDALIVALGKKAAKLGVSPPSYTVKLERPFKQDDGSEVIFSTLTLTYETIVKAGGWTFLASIETMDLVDGEPRNKVCGPYLPDEIARAYCTAPQLCQHCNQNRRRNQTYLLRGEDGAMIQVGSTCLDDFLGMSPAAAVAGLAYAAEILAIGDDEERWGCGSGAPRFVALADLAPIALSLIAKNGFVRREDAEIRFMSTTGADMGTYLFSRDPKIADWKAKVAPSDEQKAKAAEIVERLRARILEPYKADPSSLDGFSFKVGIILNRGGCDAVDFQLLAAAINREAQDMARDAMKGTRQDAYLPGAEVGKKIETEATIEMVKGIQTSFGGSTLVKMVTADGYPLTTFYSGSSQTFTPGTRVTVKGTVKRLEDGRFGKSVLLTRVKVA